MNAPEKDGPRLSELDEPNPVKGYALQQRGKVVMVLCGPRPMGIAYQRRPRPSGLRDTGPSRDVELA